MTVEEASALIKSGKRLLVAGDENCWPVFPGGIGLGARLRIS